MERLGGARGDRFWKWVSGNGQCSPQEPQTSRDWALRQAQCKLSGNARFALCRG